MILSVSLLSCRQISTGMRICYYGGLVGTSFLGIAELLVYAMEKETWMKKSAWISLIAHTILVLLFMMSRQPYVSAFLFCLLLIKVVLLVIQRQKG